MNFFLGKLRRPFGPPPSFHSNSIRKSYPKNKICNHNPVERPSNSGIRGVQYFWFPEKTGILVPRKVMSPKFREFWLLISDRAYGINIKLWSFLVAFIVIQSCVGEQSNPNRLHSVISSKLWSVVIVFVVIFSSVLNKGQFVFTKNVLIWGHYFFDFLRSQIDIKPIFSKKPSKNKMMAN